jgi:hypothetical protein
VALLSRGGEETVAHATPLPFVCSSRPGSVARVRLAGVSVPERHVALLAELLLAAGFEDTADVLLLALDAGQDLVALSIQDREAVRRVLDESPDGLSELRGVLLAE